jgi:NADH:ubiquinone oxidoreductase subunit E
MKNKLKNKITLRPRGRKVDFDILSKLEDILDTSSYRRDHLIEYLHVIQDTQGAINEDFMTALSKSFGNLTNRSL